MSICNAIILHEYDAMQHTAPLIEAFRKDGIEPQCVNLNIFRSAARCVLGKKVGGWRWEMRNIAALFRLIFIPPKKHICILALPVRSRFWWLIPHLTKYCPRIIFHTSWPRWENEILRQKNPSQVTTIRKVLGKSIVVGVTSAAALSIEDKALKTLTIPHPLNPQNYKYYESDLSLNSDIVNVVFLGRLVKEKGVLEMLSFASEHPKVHFHIAGAGPLGEVVKGAAQKTSNLTYYGQLSCPRIKSTLLSNADYYLCNSVETEDWLEAFCISMFEATLHGAVPVTLSGIGVDTAIADIGLDKFAINYKSNEAIQNFWEVCHKTPKGTRENLRAITIRALAFDRVTEMWTSIITELRE